VTGRLEPGAGLPDWDVERGEPGGQYPAENRLQLRCEVRHHLPQLAASMLGRGKPLGAGQPVVDLQIPQVLIEER
jgi:hypothetical protein